MSNPHNYSQRVDQKQSKRISMSLTKLAEKAKIDLKVKADRRSGSGEVKGDVNSLFFKMELKDREKPSKSISIKKEYYDKLEQECHKNLLAGQYPVVVFGFGDEEDIFSMRWSKFEEFFRDFLEWKVKQDV